MDTEQLRTQVLSASWDDLAPHFARGALLVARTDLDLLEAAAALAQDDVARVRRWLSDGSLRRAGHADGARLTASSPRFQVIIVQPWVLAQVLETTATAPQA